MGFFDSLPGANWSNSSYFTYLLNQDEFNAEMYQQYLAELAGQNQPRGVTITTVTTADGTTTYTGNQSFHTTNASMSFLGSLEISAALAADDFTVMGIADDPLIHFVIMGGAIISTAIAVDPYIIRP
jgi:hypothetical protein